MAQRGRSGPGRGPGRDGGAAKRAARPAGAAPRAGRRGGTKRTRAPRPRGRFTGRAVILALVLIALILAYAYPLRTYLGERAQIRQLHSSQAAQRQRIDALRHQRAKWNDPDYVAAQARERLMLVKPGDLAYQVSDEPTGGTATKGSGRASTRGPWYGKLWSSVRAADKPRTGTGHK
jgi:cell division protein FtsB